MSNAGWATSRHGELGRFLGLLFILESGCLGKMIGV